MTARKTTAKANDKDNTTPTETTILMFGSEKGGLGKTTVALVAAEQMTAANHPFFLVDADASTPNVGLTYRKEIYEQFRHQGVKDPDLLPSIYNLNKAGDRAATSILEEQITFTGDNNDFFLADRIFDIAKTQDVAIVLPSQVASYVNRWLRQNDVVGLLADPDNTIKFVYYFITNGTSESLGNYSGLKN